MCQKTWHDLHDSVGHCQGRLQLEKKSCCWRCDVCAEVQGIVRNSWNYSERRSVVCTMEEYCVGITLTMRVWRFEDGLYEPVL
ncbi:hypothetical protein ACS0TY_007491 [Phlomoides rotata]